MRNLKIACISLSIAVCLLGIALYRAEKRADWWEKFATTYVSLTGSGEIEDDWEVEYSG